MSPIKNTNLQTRIQNLKTRKKMLFQELSSIFLLSNNINIFFFPSELTMKNLTMFNCVIKKDHRQQRMDIFVILNAVFNILC